MPGRPRFHTPDSDLDNMANFNYGTSAAGSPGGSVSALVSLIVNAAKSIEAEYAKSSAPFVPSLDDLTPHPLDSQVPSPALIQATQILEGACAQLSATVVRPKQTISNVSSLRRWLPSGTDPPPYQRLMQVNNDMDCNFTTERYSFRPGDVDS